MTSRLDKYISIGILIIALPLLSGCPYTVKGVVHKPFNARAIIEHKKRSPLTPHEKMMDKRNRLQNQLAHHDVQLIQVGDEFRLVLQNDHFFYNHSPRLMEEAYFDLDNIRAYINTFKTVAVEVVGYTDNHCSLQRNFALSRQRAQNIASYLWSRGLDARLVNARGQSHCEPISTNKDAIGRSYNQRVEISWRQIIESKG